MHGWGASGRTSEEVVMACSDLGPEPAGLLVQVLRSLELLRDEAFFLHSELCLRHMQDVLLEEGLEESFDTLLDKPWGTCTLDLDAESNGAAVDRPDGCADHVAEGCFGSGSGKRPEEKIAYPSCSLVRSVVKQGSRIIWCMSATRARNTIVHPYVVS